ncbi:hypothetical protein [Silicimonas sp. MF1-12-2]|uniref:hypothetical protein n=1 Tax=Silicimonas sp. MF1-12-2 TaxID=3384793 RepID=UPI0039B67023
MTSLLRPVYDGPVSNFYILDKNDHVVETGGHWNEFAEANDAPGATDAAVFGRCVWDLIDGAETRSFLNAVFFWCRRERVGFESLYRCDGPDVSRLYRMIVEPHAGGFLWVGHRFVSSSLRPSAVTVLSDRLSGARCTMCCHYKVGDQWIDPFAAPAPHDFPSSHVLCPACRANARDGLFELSDMSVHQLVAKRRRRSTSSP